MTRRFAEVGGMRRRGLRSGSRGGATTSPATILGSLLHADFDAADPGITLNAGGVASIPNRGTDTAALVQGTAAAQPVYSATSFNSGPGMTFDRSNDNLVCTFATPIPIGRRPYVWTVFRSNNLTNTEEVVATIYGALADEPWLVIWSNRSSGTPRFSIGMKPDAGGTGDTTTLLGLTDMNAHLAEVGVTVGGVAGYVFDGATTNVPVGVAVPLSAPLTRLHVAAYGAVATQFFGGVIRRVIVANDLPSAAQIAAMRAYLRSQPYGLTF